MSTYQFPQRIDSSQAWSTVNPVLALGELGIEVFAMDSNGAITYFVDDVTGEKFMKMKIGDGVNPWMTLPYFGAGSSGEMGPPGIQGTQGEKGEAGMQGLQGEPREIEPGNGFSLTEEGVLKFDPTEMSPQIITLLKTALGIS